MFDFAWSEIALIGVVALIAIGPKDLPVAMKTVAQMVKKARRMAGEFQTHVDEMVREANLHEVRDTIADIRRMDIKGKILDAVDSDKTLRNTLNENTFSTTTTDFHPPPPPVPVHDAEPLPERVVEAHPEHAMATPLVDDGRPPPFIPPAVAAAGPRRPAPPSFVPPGAVAARALAARRGRSLSA